MECPVVILHLQIKKMTTAMIHSHKIFARDFTTISEVAFDIHFIAGHKIEHFPSVSSVLTRAKNVSTRSMNDSTRAKNISTRSMNDSTRAMNDSTRVKNISTRVMNDSTRAKNISTRVMNASTRAKSVSTRVLNASTGAKNHLIQPI